MCQLVTIGVPKAVGAEYEAGHGDIPEDVLVEVTGRRDVPTQGKADGDGRGG